MRSHFPVAPKRATQCRWTVPLGLCLVLGAAPHGQSAPANAQHSAYPDHPIRMLVGFAPGGGTDTTARAIANKLTATLGQQVVIDNRPGAAGNIAAHIAAKSAPDGHTLLMGTIAALAINPTLYGNLPFDPLRDFAPITQAVNSTNVLVVHPSVQATHVKELIALARAQPGKVLYGSSGVGGAGHLAGELFASMARVKMVHVPYKGGGPVMVDLVAGQIQCVFATAVTALPHMRSGRVRALGVTTMKRAGMMPDIPTIAEQGLPGFDANNWYGVLAPAKTPRDIIDRLNGEIVKILREPDVKEYLHNQGLDPAPTTPEEFAAYIKAEIGKWSRIVREASASAT